MKIIKGIIKGFVIFPITLILFAMSPIILFPLTIGGIDFDSSLKFMGKIDKIIFGW